MRPKTDIWQGYRGYWQDRFLQENLLPVGHRAWQGYLTKGRGMVVCEVAKPNDEFIDWTIDIVEYALRYVPLAQTSAYLRILNLEETLIDCVEKAIGIYEPSQQILLLISAHGRADISLLQHLAISPVDCYRHLQLRWSEFRLDDFADG